MHRVYLAGPDVFRPDAAEHGRKLVELCSDYGFEGVFPLDDTVVLSEGRSPQELATQIYHGNVSRIDSCDAVIANLDFFRGLEPDSGTCFEVGYAAARGKVVIGYIPDEGSIPDRIRRRAPSFPQSGTDTNGWRVEDFGLPLNLMLAVSCRIVVGDACTALEALRSTSMRSCRGGLK
ncbi:nucleoside 2-deoxyribosyltransferase [Ramlibacter sp. MMS24-I3-19]|uniref:nucleoside 2-deoxyribosyltransferase n=1 Tax=Ramlibacter sp. MMS24-I3-19 TaxID=3416606 RepID=UPI003D04D294